MYVQKQDKGIIDLSRYPEEGLEKINKPCTDELVEDADQYPKKICDGLGCDVLFSALNGDWSAGMGTPLALKHVNGYDYLVPSHPRDLFLFYFILSLFSLNKTSVLY